MNDAEKEALIAEIFQCTLSKSVREGLTEMCRPPEGFDTWADYEKYGEAFIPLDGPPTKRQGYLDEV